MYHGFDYLVTTPCPSHMKSSNFDFIHSCRKDIRDAAREAEQHGITAPVTCGMYGRVALERAVYWIYDHDSALPNLHLPTLNGLMVEPAFRAIVPQKVIDAMHYVRRESNPASHGSKISRASSMAILKYLHHVLYWLENSYSAERPPFAVFDEGLIPKIGAGAKTKAEAEKLRLALAEEQEKLRLEAEKLRAAEEENAQLRLQMEAMRERREEAISFAVPPSPYTEKETRQLFIDVLLREAGWDPEAPRTREYEVLGMPLADNPSGKGLVDYVLWGDDGLPLAVIEAKRTQRSQAEGLVQAGLYADALERRFGQRPFIYLSNGFDTSFLEEPFYNSPRRVSGIASRDELQYRMGQRQNRKDLRKQAIPTAIVNRHYQLEAVGRVADALVGDDGKGKLHGIRRAGLLVMATGSGKTRVSAALVDVFAKAGWIKRVLFLADRNALVTQAKRNFNSYLPSMSAIDLTKEQPDPSTRIVFSTYQTIMNRIDQTRTDGARYFSPGHFDLIIVDEAHRSVYDRYKAIFDYFDAIRIGLTATPRSENDHDTYQLFDCPDQDPTACYELANAVADGYLCPPIGKPCDFGFIQQGIRYADLSDAEKQEYELKFRDDQGQVPATMNASAINNWLFNVPTLDNVIVHFMENGLKVEGGDKIGKTVVFARNHAHALAIKARFDQAYPHLPSGFAQVIDNFETYAQGLIDAFSVGTSLPQVAISVDMLDTGIDVPEILNLVFFKPVYSSSKYWQMVGRGTRLCPDIFGPDQHKTHFLIFDYCGNFEFFGHNADGLQVHTPKSLSHRLFEARLSLSNFLKLGHFQDDTHIGLRVDLLDKCHSCIADLWAQRDSFRLRPILRLLDEFKTRSAWDNLSEGNISDLVTEAGRYVDFPGDERAKRYDLLALELQISLAVEDGEHMPILGRISRNLDLLIGLTNIQEVKRRLPLMQETQKIVAEARADQAPGWPSDWEKLRIEVRELQQYLKVDDLKPIFTHFLDRFEVGEDAHDLVKQRTQLEPYRLRVERFIRENRHHLTVAKLHSNLPVTASDIEELERMLFESIGGGDHETLMREIGSEKPLGWFIRSIVGMDVQAARSAFADFIAHGKLRPDQVNFMEAIIQHLTQNGVIDKAMLAETPFTDIHDQGVFGVFGEGELVQLVSLIDEVNGNAVA
jgi:type I restriction enzyme R subunit